MVHRSRAYFERCYAADFDPRVRRTERHACWVAWLDHYTAAQPRERIMYARERVAAQSGDAAALLMPGVEVAAPSPSGEPAPLPGPPAARARDEAPAAPSADGAVSAARPARLEPSIPPPPRPAVPRRGSPACAPICEPRFVACVERCPSASPEACRDACTAEHRACGNACL